MLLDFVLPVLLLLQGADAQPTPATLEAAEAPVEVRSVPDDDSIARRLSGILQTTGRYEGVELRVENGVVLLDGLVEDEAAGLWVEELAARTEGVVAVLNGLERREAPLWDLGPARSELTTMWRAFLRSLPRIGAGLLVLLAAVVFAGGLSRLLVLPLERKLQNELVRTVATKLVAGAVWLGAAYLFLRISGLTQLAVTVVGGTGILGIILGFAFRDIAENFLASILISLQRPFRYGDTIEVAGHLGVVQRVTPRGTILMNLDGNHVQITNAQVYKSTIVNRTSNPRIRLQFVVGVGFDADLPRAQQVVMDLLHEHSAVLNDPPPMVLVDQLGSATVDLRVYFWIDGVQHSMFKVRSAVQRLVVGAFQEAGVSMPDPAREVVFPQGVPVTVRRGDAAVLAPPASVPAHRSAEVEATDAEGGLVSETIEIEKQVRTSRQPEEGVDVMAG
ncbi:MAG TPA: mechanosensitive ion channel family protein [Planctomycetota bacterium]|nr:mechanosensitive ion channel family protein [Planctomycetota bacterium]